MIDGFARGRATPIYTINPDAGGWVRMDFPDADPYVQAHPGQREFNLELDIAVPGVTAPRVVTAVTFVFDRIARREATVAKVSGTSLVVPTIPLGTGITSMGSVMGAPVDVDTSCELDMPEYECAKTWKPPVMEFVPTVFANNAGAGFDTNLDITYDHAGRVQTSTAGDLGCRSGRIQGRNRHRYL